MEKTREGPGGMLPPVLIKPARSPSGRKECAHAVYEAVANYTLTNSSLVQNVYYLCKQWLYLCDGRPRQNRSDHLCYEISSQSTFKGEGKTNLHFVSDLSMNMLPPRLFAGPIKKKSAKCSLVHFLLLPLKVSQGRINWWQISVGALPKNIANHFDGYQSEPIMIFVADW